MIVIKKRNLDYESISVFISVTVFFLLLLLKCCKFFTHIVKHNLYVMFIGDSG